MAGLLQRQQMQPRRLIGGGQVDPVAQRCVPIVGSALVLGDP
ncbi:hypothetical protein KUC_2762 [Vreelandella boliviensis LC1]|uniref:Uncharacterized protein n=1 Tax=Vreelandella boliviensis LC1 TaxID=1072583 RepID=A0A7U9GFY8_9GAMM|nr:hypothetical protein KUC_2762 [Halomonas boliviensis LC1]